MKWKLSGNAPTKVGTKAQPLSCCYIIIVSCGLPEFSDVKNNNTSCIQFRKEFERNSSVCILCKWQFLLEEGNNHNTILKRRNHLELFKKSLLLSYHKIIIISVALSNLNPNFCEPLRCIYMYGCTFTVRVNWKDERISYFLMPDASILWPASPSSSKDKVPIVDHDYCFFLSPSRCFCRDLQAGKCSEIFIQGRVMSVFASYKAGIKFLEGCKTPGWLTASGERVYSNIDLYSSIFSMQYVSVTISKSIPSVICNLIKPSPLK